jgi:hypothetical protein
VQEHLEGKFYEFIEALVDQDKNKINKLAEKRFANRLIHNLEKANGISFEKGPGLLDEIIQEDTTDYGDFRENLVSDMNSNYTIDTLLIKGISPHREDNDCNYDYRLFSDSASLGMLYYEHKYFSGHMHYYLHLKYHQSLKRYEELAEKMKIWQTDGGKGKSEPMK